MAKQKYTALTPFYRGDTPLFIVPCTNSATGSTLDMTGWTGYLTFNTEQYPTTSDAPFLHTTMSYATTDTLGVGYTNYFYYQFTNTDTEPFDPEASYYWDVQVNKSPTATNNFTLMTGTFEPYGDISRGLS